MLSLTNPKVLLALIIAFGAVFGWGRHYEYLENQAEVARLNAQARETEQRRQSDANAAANELRKANRDAQAEITRLNSDVATGAVRLSIATRSVSACSDAGAAAGSSAEARTELDPTAAQDLIAIAAEGDEAIRQLNSCIDIYNKVRSNP